MDIQSVPKVGISSVVHSKHIDADNIDVVDNDIALFDTESVISLYNGPTKLEVLTVGLCLEGTGTFKISLREFQLCPGLMVIALPNQIIEQRYFSHDFKGIFFAVSKNLLETLPKIGNVLSLWKNDKFLASQGKKMDKAAAKKFLSKGKIHYKDLVSTKTAAIQTIMTMRTARNCWTRKTITGASWN